MFKSEELNKILSEEIALGNEVKEQTSWLPKCNVLVILQNRFSKRYQFENVEFRQVNDGHYWLAEYSSKSKNECLACGFLQKYR
ncbi:hypothetical protein [Photobacterium sanguinicancri]|uniref:hypothetical protein n=1 Tax=Photobacterium sanguinicancri TaxID=875932 RepID=UPI0026E168A9|nr:hypothetical protein [Photobacterium sanguinicancri]MDO6501194.1 hypothetical protein [Photobacterium sanguinicancri]